MPSIIWLYWSGDTTWGTVLLVWSCVVGTMDNVIRPVLIRMGADLPMILILTGVIGGPIASRHDRPVYRSGAARRLTATV
ncbi:AI-2E family transporter [Klebsiella pneumoniae subsp. pneumoniae]|nr:AI-2E family transporter [Klebsiella pneumoniae subsp. pneumoniae]